LAIFFSFVIICRSKHENEDTCCADDSPEKRIGEHPQYLAIVGLGIQPSEPASSISRRKYQFHYNLLPNVSCNVLPHELNVGD
jgi:hypothetical protein